jgi:hypothetical protein
MTTEMDIMGMDERQRLAWLHANRVTLILVGLTWIGMIAWEVIHDQFPMFLIAMVPVFAIVRFSTYRYYQRASRGNTA